MLEFASATGKLGFHGNRKWWNYYWNAFWERSLMYINMRLNQISVIFLMCLQHAAVVQRSGLFYELEVKWSNEIWNLPQFNAMILMILYIKSLYT